MDIEIPSTILPSTTDDLLLDNLSPADIFRYSRASKTTNQVVSSYMRRIFTLHKLLGRFFTENEMSSFQFLQSRTGLLISGSTALQFFERVFYPESDLDLYVEIRHCRVVTSWLISIGYTYEPRPDHSDESLEKALEPVDIFKTVDSSAHPSTEDYFDFGVADVYDFHKSDPDCKIQLVTSYYSPLEPILRFHSTCVMNLISHEKAYSLYPRGTFNERRSLVLPREDENEERARVAREKYIARGWNMVHALTRVEIVDPTSAFSPGSRYVGDSKCWTIPILPKLQLPAGYIGTNSWDLVHHRTNNAEILFTNLIAPFLRHSYLVKDTSLERYIVPVLLKAYKGEDEYMDDDLELRLKSYRAGIQKMPWHERA